MVMKPQPLVAAIEAARADLPGAHVVLLTPQGARFDQRKAEELSSRARLVLVCGRYEGVDERVRGFVDEEISLGDFVLTGGEVAALAVIDAVARLVPGVLGNEESPRSESFGGEMLLEGPQYTRPAEFRGQRVPEVLLSGDHARIARWRRKEALVRTRERRPDLLERARLSDDDRTLLSEAEKQA
jgi:tRNA (guanine37-N1)-methyltransferase